MKNWFPGKLWSGLMIPMIVAPVLVMFLPPRPNGSGFWWDLAIAFGFSGLAMFGMQFLLTARFRRITAPFGIDIIYLFHRYLAILGLAMVFFHYSVFRIKYPASLGKLLPGDATWYMSAGRLALLFFIVIILTSLLRKKLNLEYDYWRLLHSVLAISAIFLAVGHMLGVGNHSGISWKSVYWYGYASVLGILVLYIRLYKPWRLSGQPYTLTAVKNENSRVTTLTVQPTVHNGFSFQPGQFAWISIDKSPFLLKEHPFSIASAPAPDGIMQFSIKAFGDFTEKIKYVKPGCRVYVDGPHGAFTIDRFPLAGTFVFIAGGIGIAPVISMLRTMALRRDRRSCILIYANNTKEDILFYDELEHLKESLDIHIHHVLRTPPASWTGESGIIDKEMLSRLLSWQSPDPEYFVCGPKLMARSIQACLNKLDVPSRRVHNELFDLV